MGKVFRSFSSSYFFFSLSISLSQCQSPWCAYSVCRTHSSQNQFRTIIIGFHSDIIHTRTKAYPHLRSSTKWQLRRIRDLFHFVPAFVPLNLCKSLSVRTRIRKFSYRKRGEKERETERKRDREKKIM